MTNTVETHTASACECGRPATTTVMMGPWPMGWCGRLPEDDLVAEGHDLLREMVALSENVDRIAAAFNTYSDKMSDTMGGCPLTRGSDPAGQLAMVTTLGHVQYTLGQLTAATYDDDPDPELTEAREVLR